jgi:hypothetical protein
MSGSGGGGNPPPNRGCSSLSFTTTLASPKAAVIATVAVGDVLQIEILPGAVRIVGAKTNGGHVAGTITTHTAKLIECIDEGYAYEAEVKDKKAAFCSVLVRPK